jgi:hypothetical protein
MSRLGITEIENELVRSSLDFDVRLDQGSLEDIREDLSSAEPVGCSVRHFLPNRLSLRINRREEDANLIASVICEDSPKGPRRRVYLDRDIMIPPGVLGLLRDILGDKLLSVIQPESAQARLFQDEPFLKLTLREWSERIRRLPPLRRAEIRRLLRSKADLHDAILDIVRRGIDDSFELIQGRPPMGIQEAIQYLDYFFSSSVKYLGPLRDEPKPLYPLAASPDPTDVGLRGELTAAVFELHKTRRIQYIPSTHFKSPVIQEGQSLRGLETAVADWLPLCHNE